MAENETRATPQSSCCLTSAWSVVPPPGRNWRESELASLSLYPRTFLPAAPGESLVGGGGSSGFGGPLSRLERADHARVLRPKLPRPTRGRAGQDRQSPQ